MLGSERKFILKCNKEGEFLAWKKCLSHAINNSNGKKKNLALKTYEDDEGKSVDFWRFLRITEEDFINMAETGDLLLGVISKKSLTSSIPIYTVLDVYLLINVVIDAQNTD